MLALQAESDLLATTGSDRSVALYDLRSGGAIRKVVMQTRCNAVAWNPMEAFNFVAANEDCNLYTYDMRKLNTAACVHQVSAADEAVSEDEACSDPRETAMTRFVWTLYHEEDC